MKDRYYPLLRQSLLASMQGLPHRMRVFRARIIPEPIRKRLRPLKRVVEKYSGKILAPLRKSASGFKKALRLDDPVNSPLADPMKAIVRQRIIKQARQEVLSGLFQGMKFPFPDPRLPMILGTHELEIRPAFQKLGEFKFDLIVNIGEHLGYYSVGLALLHPESTMRAFETEERWHALSDQLAKANSVAERIEHRGFCGSSELSQALNEPQFKSILIVADIEGGEVELLNLETVPELRNTALLIETHDITVKDCTDLMKRRFEETHTITEYSSRARTIEDFPMKVAQYSLFRAAAVRSMWEGRRGSTGWLLMLPISWRE